MKRIEEENADHETYLQEVQDEEDRKNLEKAAERIEGLQGKKDEKVMKEEEITWAKQIYDEYSVSDESQRPGDWTQEL